MLKHFSPEVQRVLQLARELFAGEVTELGTDHLVMAMAEVGGVAGNALKSAGISPQIPPASRQTSPSNPATANDVPYAEETMVALRRAFEKGISGSRGPVSTNQLLLSILEDGNNAGSRFLRDQGIDVDEIVEAVRSDFLPITTQSQGPVPDFETIPESVVFTVEALSALARGHQIALELNQTIQPHHLVVALIERPGVAREAVQSQFGKIPSEVAPRVTADRAAKFYDESAVTDVLDHAFKLAIAGSGEQVNTGHILEAILETRMIDLAALLNKPNVDRSALLAELRRSANRLPGAETAQAKSTFEPVIQGELAEP